MPVFDFSAAPAAGEKTVCTYTTFPSNEKEKTPEHPILVLDNTMRAWKHHSGGVFSNQTKRTAFEFKEDGETFVADILRVDARFVSLLRWLGRSGKRDLAVERNFQQKMVSFSL